MKTFLKHPIVYAVLILVSSWSTIRWYVARMLDGSDEPWGVLALLCSVVFSLRSLTELEISRTRGWGCFACLAVLWYAGGFLTPLLHGVLVFGALAFLLAAKRFWIGHAGLFLLSLPLISSLQFYGGYPLRWVIGIMSSFTLGLFGQSVEAVGTVMHWRGEIIVIDAPCSGVQMLWSSAFFACLLICIYKMDVWSSIKLLQLTSLTAFAANVVRNCLLFFVESGLVEVGEWAHRAIGILVFVGALLVVGWFGKRVNKQKSKTENRVIVTAAASTFRFVPAVALCCLCCLLAFEQAGSKRLLFEGKTVTSDLAAEVDLSLLRKGWYPIPLDDSSVRFAKSFPGCIMTYEQDNRRLVVRIINRATRRYHLSADCYRATGYAIKPMSMLKQADGSMWGRISATRDEEKVEVRERVVSQDGREWTDPSSWFWSAMFSQSQGPWIAYSESVIL